MFHATKYTIKYYNSQYTKIRYKLFLKKLTILEIASCELLMI